MTQAFNLAQLANKVNSSGQLNAGTGLSGATTPTNGGTGATGTPTNGQIPIGNGTNFTLAALTAGAGVTITNSAGGIIVAATTQIGRASCRERVSSPV